MPSTGAADDSGFEIKVFWRPPGYGCRYLAKQIIPMQAEIPEFEQGPHRFRIVTNESCMIRSLTLSVFAASEKPNKPFWVDIYRVTEGDHIWNTLVADRANENGDYDLMPAIKYLHDYAPQFSAEHPDALRFSSHKNAERFSEKHLKAPVNVRGFPFSAKYPGT